MANLSGTVLSEVGVLVVHGGWVPRADGPGRLALWAEDPAPTSTSSSRARIRPHPAAVSAAALAATLSASSDDIRDAVAKASDAALPLYLPGTAQGPLPSPETGRETPTRGVGLRSWTVPVLLLPGEDALTALGALADPDPDGPWLAATSVRYLSVLAGFACDLAHRGRMLPQLVLEDGVPAARWRPVLTGADAATYRDFATAMPPVCRSTVLADSVPSAGSVRSDIDDGERTAGVGRTLRDALDAMVDAAARSVMPERLLLGHRPGPRAPLADRWAVALTAADPALPGAAADEVSALTLALDDWMRAAADAHGPVRVSFRLVEPAPGSDDWRLDFALQSAEDPSLYLPAPDLWAGAGMPGLSQRPDEMLLAGLGRAVRLFPLLHEPLLGARPAGMTLNTGEAHQFLRQAAPLLQAAGFGVQLPTWAGRKAVGLKLTTRSRSSSRAAAGSGFGLDELVDFRIDLVIGDGVVDAEELAELARLKMPLVRVRGQWVELDDRQLRAALKVVDQRRDRRDDRRRGAAAGGRGRRRGPAAGRGATPTARSATSSPVRPPSGSPRYRRPTRSPEPCGHTRNVVCPGCTSWPGSASAASWPTTWVSARLRRRSRCCSRSGSPGPPRRRC